MDNLRGLAILLVLGAHVPAPPGGTGCALLVRAWQQVGWIGVDLFFTLSGFLVGGLLFKSWSQHGRLLAGRFLLRRAFKIYPAFYAMLGLMVLCKPQYFDRSLLLSEVFFLQNYWVHFFPHSWTLAVEEHFYIFLPLLLFMLRGRKEAPFARLPFVFCLIAITCLTVRVWMIWAGGFTIWNVFLPTHLRVDSLLAGVLVAWMYHFHRAALASFATRWKKRLIQAALILASPALLWTLADQPFVYTFGLTGMWLAASMVIIVAIHTQSQSGVLAWFGRYSYSVYLWHFTAKRLFIPTILLPHQRGEWLEFWVYIGLSVVCGALSTWMIEQPFLRLRDRFFPHTPRPVSGGTTIPNLSTGN